MKVDLPHQVAMGKTLENPFFYGVLKYLVSLNEVLYHLHTIPPAAGGRDSS